MAGKRVIIRTLDIGADKQCDYFHMEHEENPALGCRAIRICLTRPEIFKTQLRALLRAAVYGNLSIMFPMIISVSEVKKIKEIIAQVQAELKAEGIPYKEDVELGVMIETPAAVMISRELAKEVDFFSVDVDENPGLAAANKVFSVPTLILYKNGVEASRSVGAISKYDLLDFIEKIK